MTARSVLREFPSDPIVEACAAGDRVAQGLLFRRHAAEVRRFVARLVRGDVDDVVQATFLAAFRGAERFRGPNVRGWLFGIAANLVRTHVRDEITRRRALAAFDGAFASTHEPEHDLQKLRDAIAALPHKLRAVLVRIELEGEISSVAATALGISEATVWRRLAEARMRLRAAMDRMASTASSVNCGVVRMTPARDTYTCTTRNARRRKSA
jgi:RNA polymerase sigma-70 factor (ECF subfamily)